MLQQHLSCCCCCYSQLRIYCCWLRQWALMSYFHNDRQLLLILLCVSVLVHKMWAHHPLLTAVCCTADGQRQTRSEKTPLVNVPQPTLILHTLVIARKSKTHGDTGTSTRTDTSDSPPVVSCWVTQGWLKRRGQHFYQKVQMLHLRLRTLRTSH